LRLLSRNRVHLPESEVEGIVYRLGHYHTGKVNLHEFSHTINSLYPLHMSVHRDYNVDIVHKSPVKEGSSSKLLDSDHKLEMARRELNRSRNLGNSLSGSKYQTTNSVHNSRHGSGRKLL